MHKEESAHNDGIWSCAIGKCEESKNVEDAEDDGHMIGDIAKKSTESTDFIVTGGLDDLVKVWDIKEDNTLKLRHQLKGHALGVVSVAVSSDGQSNKEINNSVFLL